jgi:hypothetical protein
LLRDGKGDEVLVVGYIDLERFMREVGEYETKPRRGAKL